MADVYVVDTYQVNVGAGDCSIHVLAKNPGLNDNRGDIVHAALVDGGKIGGRREYISQTLRDIGARYNNASTNSVAPMQFHSLVVSHWDEDHYLGMMDLLTTDLAKQYDDTAKGIVDRYDDWDKDPNRKPEDMPARAVDLSKIRCSYLKYGTNGEIQTTLYCPIWESDETAEYVVDRPVPKKKGQKPSAPKKMEWNGAPTHDQTVKLDPKTGIMSVNAGGYQVDAINAARGKASERKNMFISSCKVVSNAEDLIGRNIFTNVLFRPANANPAQPWTNIKSLDMLIQGHKLPAGMPGMYCVAATRQVIGRPKVAWNAVDADSTTSFDNSQNNLTNGMSLTFIIAWSSTSAQNKPRASLYTGGDAEGYIETRLLPFLSDTNRVAVIKAGHHGSELTLQPAFISKLNPLKIVISAGDEYRHPHWTRLALLFLHWSRQIYEKKRGAEAFLWSTCHPYWTIVPPKRLGADDPDKLQLEEMMELLNVAPFYASVDKPFRTTLVSWYDDYVKALEPGETYRVPNVLAEYENIITQYNDLTSSSAYPKPVRPQSATLKVLLPALMGLFREMWEALSDIPLADTATNALDSTGKVVYGTPRLSQLWIKHRDTDADGEIVIHRNGRWEKVEKATKDVKNKRETSEGEDWRMQENKAQNGRVRKRPDYFNEEVVPEPKQRKKGKATPEPLQIPTNTLFARFRAGAPLTASADSASPPSVTSSLKLRFITSWDLQPSSSSVSVREDDPMDDFLAALVTKRLALEEIHEISPGQVVRLDDKNLSPKSEFTQWVTESIGATKMCLSTVVDRQQNAEGTAKIVGWTCVADLKGASTNSESCNLEFSSSAKLLAQTLNLNAGAPGGTIEDTGYSPGLGAVVLALVKAPTATVTLAQICTFLGHPLEWLHGLLGDVKLQVTQDIDDQSDADARRMVANAIWLRPHLSSSVAIRLHLRQATGSGIEGFIKEHLPSVTLTDVRVIAYKDARHVSFQAGSSYVYKVESKLTMVARIGLGQSASTNFMTAIGYGTEGLNICLRWDGASDPISDVIQWINKLISPDGNAANVTQLNQSTFSSFLHDLGASNPLKLRRIFLQIGSDKKLQEVRIEFEIDLDFGAPKEKQVPLLATFSWTPIRTSFRAELWPKNLRPKDYPGPWIWPKYEPWMVMSSSSQNPVDHFSLLHLRPRNAGDADETIDKQLIPAGIPTKIDDAILEISSTFTRISAEVVCDPAAMKSHVPAIGLESVRLFAEYRRAQEKTPAAFDLNMEGTVTLHPRKNILTPELSFSTAEISVRLSHHAKTASTPESWTLSAAAYDLQLASLYSLFSSGGPQDAIMNFLEHLYIPEMSVVYQFNKGVASSFVLKGAIIIADVELDLEYRHDADGWVFKVLLTPEKRAAFSQSPRESPTLGSFLGHISEDMLEYVPDLVANIPIDLKTDTHIALVCKSDKASSDDAKQTPGSLTMAFVIEVGALQVTLVQVQDYSRNPDKSIASSETQKMSPRRLTKLTLDELHFPDAGIIGQLQQPFEALNFVWSSADLAESQVALLNADILQDPVLFPGKKEPLRYKKQGPGGTQVISAGCHLMLTAIRSGVTSVILDYAFGAEKKDGTNPAVPPPVNGTSKQPAVAPTLQGSGEEKSTSIAESKNALTITTLGVALKSRVLSFTLTAKLAFGPLALGLIDFVLHVDYNQARHLRDIDKITLSASIGGMEVEYDKAPVVLAGLFRHIVKDNLNLYTGGINLGIVPYKFLAAGMYGDAKGPPPSRETFKTMFIFVKLNGPLVELEFAEINGICGGFGYNSNLRFPDISQLGQFPLLTTDGNAKDPLEELNALTDSTQGWITPRSGALWLAAGLEVKAFQVIDISAVAAINLGESVTVGLFAEAVAKLPKGVPDEEVLLLVDFLFTAQVDFTKGTLLVGGQLAPRSFVLHRSCRLTGGIALGYWFPNSDHPGDWVLTIGGYHPQFKKPAHYPNADRLGISWQYDEHLYISGGAYFALTPRLCMAGVRLQARFQMDSLSANFEAHADFLVNFEPFQFQGDIGVSIHVKYDVDYGIGHDTVSADVSAGLKLHGPPVGGTAFIDVHVFSVSVDFGEDYKPQPARTLEQFWSIVCQGKDEQVKHTISIENDLPSGGSVQPTNAPTPKHDFVVQGHSFQCRVALRAAASSIQYGTSPAVPGQPVHAKLCKMAGNNLKSEAAIKVYRMIDGKPDTKYLPLEMAVEKKRLPSVLWSEYTLASDPDVSQSAANSALSTPSPDTIDHIMGVTLKTALPKPSEDHIPAINLEEASKVHLLTDKAKPPQVPIAAHDAALPSPFAKSEDAKEAWQKNDRTISRDKILASFSSLVATTGGPKEGSEFKNLSTAQPRQLFTEWHDLFANAPDTVPKIEVHAGTAAAPPDVPHLTIASPKVADPALWYSGLPWK